LSKSDSIQTIDQSTNATADDGCDSKQKGTTMYLTVFYVSVVMFFVNLPWALTGNTANIVSMVICLILAVVHFWLATHQKNEK